MARGGPHISARVYLALIGVFLTTLVVAGVRAWVAVRTVEVGGPLYAKIIADKDLVADILPPPAYVVEAYATVLELATDIGQVPVERVSHLRLLEEQYHKSLARWKRELPAGDKREYLVGDSAEHAKEFFREVNERFIPAVEGEDAGLALELARGALGECYRRHREAIDRVVNLARRDGAETEAIAARVRADSRASFVTLAVLLCATLFVVAFMCVAQLREARRANAATRAKSDFLANMSHEIRTPMTAILGYADLLLDSGADADVCRAHIGTIRRNGEHLLAVINDILDLSKIEAGRMEIESIPTRLARLLAEVDALMQVPAAHKSIALRCELASEFPETVITDPLRLRQILVNLVGNAVKFTDAGEVRVSAAMDGEMLRVSVRDTGVGMTPEQIGRLFAAFTQADTSMTRRFGGTGLGLTISKNLAQQLGGDIKVTSEPGRGSEFVLTVRVLPVAGSATVGAGPVVAAGGALDAAPAVARNDSRPLDGVRVFVAEDGPDNQRLIAFHLGKAGAQVRLFENGRRALEALTTDGTADGPLQSPRPCDVMLTDMQMPEMDGYTLARTLRERGWELPIIALTAHAMSDDARKCLDAGCDRYATKPINREQLIDCVRPARAAA